MTDRVSSMTWSASAARRRSLSVVVAMTLTHAASGDDASAYCPVLARVAALASTPDAFAGIAGRAREGNYLDTTLPLPGWGDCAFYGLRAYTCDSLPFATAEEGGRAFVRILDETAACLSDGWQVDRDRASPGYAVLRNRRQTASITINTDRTARDEHVVRLILFLRGR